MDFFSPGEWSCGQKVLMVLCRRIDTMQGGLGEPPHCYLRSYYNAQENNARFCQPTFRLSDCPFLPEHSCPVTFDLHSSYFNYPMKNLLHSQSPPGTYWALFPRLIKDGEGSICGFEEEQISNFLPCVWVLCGDATEAAKEGMRCLSSDTIMQSPGGGGVCGHLPCREKTFCTLCPSLHNL